MAFNLQRSSWNAADHFSQLHWLPLTTWNILKSGHIFCGHFTRSPKLESYFNCCPKHLAMYSSYTPSLLPVSRRLASFFSVYEDSKREWEIYCWSRTHLCRTMKALKPPAWCLWVCCPLLTCQPRAGLSFAAWLLDFFWMWWAHSTVLRSGWQFLKRLRKRSLKPLRVKILILTPVNTRKMGQLCWTSPSHRDGPRWNILSYTWTSTSTNSWTAGSNF